ncbi:hypothetical protein C8Q75DRAFT_760851 [Abortiporus biennis]|nr:hypothetical protein C8Q75DRAFT_760851 [Abortiporus biennis]
MYIEQQRSAELAQTMRMHAIQEESGFSVSTTSLPYLVKTPKLESPLCGLGLPKATQDKRKVGDAVDKATEPIEKFKYPTIPSKSSSLARARDSLKNFPKIASRRNMQGIQLPLASSKDSKDILEDEDSLEEDVAEVVVRMAQTRSMEIKRGVLVALGGSTVDVPHLFFSSPSIASHNNLASLSSSSTSLNSDSNHLRPESAYMINMDLGDETNTFPSPPPMLSPILPTSFELSDEIEKSLGLFSEGQGQTCTT